MACTTRLPFEVQSAAHSILVDFVNGNDVSWPGKLLYPLFDSFGIGMQRQLIRLVELLKGSERKCGFQEAWRQISKLDLHVPIEPLSVAVILSSVYHDLHCCAECQELNLNYHKVSVGSSLPVLGAGEYYRSIGLQGLLDYVRLKLQHYLIGFYLHGSMATLDFVPGYSDVDTLAIISEHVLFDPAGLTECRRALLEATRFLYLVDPLQHHGHGVLTEVDLSFYAQPYFPIVLYAFSRPILESGKRLAIRERDAFIERQRAFLEAVDFFTCVYQSGKKPQGQYAWKLFLSTLVLLPSLFLQLKRQYTYKRDSFEKVRNEFSQDEWYIIERATAVRQQWQIVSPLFIRKLLTRCSPNPWLLPVLYRRFHNKMPAWAMQLLGDSALHDARTLAIAMRKRATEEGYLENYIA